MSRLILLACAVGLVVLPSLAQASELIAHYPLASDALDATGNYDPITLTNAPFEEGGVYCNGIYTHRPGGCLVETPYLSALDFESLSISAQFKIPAVYDEFHPILVGGSAWRWLGAEISESLGLHFLYNDDLHPTGVVVTSNV